MEHKKLLEAALFVSPKPIMLTDLGKILGVQSIGYVKGLIDELQKGCADRGIEIVNTPEGYQMQVRPEFLDKVGHLNPHSDLSEGCKRTLALVLYKEPAKQSEIIKLQGNKAYNYIKELYKRGLIKAEREGHTKILKVTQELESYFGLPKEKIKEQLKVESQQNL
ncbi:MAG: SMC-Scp complex subunit ScpB [Candidatus Aenigmarchaeota archaeon]|nr:SMC-Scp complex subunit ScpB [Candidatus Aenigmarchaeota archaeon]